MGDIPEVQSTLLELLLTCSQPIFLSDRQILITYAYILDKMEKMSTKNKAMTMNYFNILLNLKRFLADPMNPNFEQKPQIISQINEKIVSGLST